MSSYPEHPLNFDSYSLRRRREWVAIHESAHATLAIKVGGCGVDRVELWPGVQPDGSTPDGITTYPGSARALPRSTMIKILLGGALAEKLDGSIDFANCTDFDRVARLLKGSGLDYKELLIETEALVRRYWTEIELLAHELMHRRVLVGDEIIEAMTPWSVGK